MGIPFDFIFGFFHSVVQPSFSKSQEIWLFLLAHLSQVPKSLKIYVVFNFFFFKFKLDFKI